MNKNSQYGVMRLRHYTGYGNRCCLDDTTHVTLEAAVREARNDMSDVICVFEIRVDLGEIKTLYTKSDVEDQIEADEIVASKESFEDRLHGTYEQQVQSTYNQGRM